MIKREALCSTVVQMMMDVKATTPVLLDCDVTKEANLLFMIAQVMLALTDYSKRVSLGKAGFPMGYTLCNELEFKSEQFKFMSLYSSKP